MLSAVLFASVLTAQGFDQNVPTTGLIDAKNDPSFRLLTEDHEKIDELEKKVAHLKKVLVEVKSMSAEKDSTIATLEQQLRECEKGVPAAATPMVTGTLKTQTKPYFCPTGRVLSENGKTTNDDMAKWHAQVKQLRESKVCRNCGSSGSWDIPMTPDYWCDKLINNIKPWMKPKLTTDDVAVGIFTGESLFYGRASATRDTWLLQFKHHYMFSAKSEPRIPVIGLSEIEEYKKYNFRDERMNAQWGQLLGLKEMYHRAPDAKWYIILGCDNYVHADYLLRRLDDYDHTKPFWLAQFTNDGETVHRKINLTDFPKYQTLPDKLKNDRKFEWTSGGIGWVMSNSLVKEYAKEIVPFMEYIPPFEICYCPDKITGLLFSLLGFTITKFKGIYESSMLAYAPDSGDMCWQAMEANEFMIYHYMSPRKLLAADQRIQHEKLDRMVCCLHSLHSVSLTLFCSTGERKCDTGYCRLLPQVHRFAL
jgi:uncharacterized coiled-coil protein SlyX